MDISERRVIYSPKYEGTNNLIKRRFRLNRMVCRAWAQKRTPLIIIIIIIIALWYTPKTGGIIKLALAGT